MAGRNINDITVEIGGDTTKLQTALEGVNSKIKSSQAGKRSDLQDQKNGINRGYLSPK